MRWVFDHVGLIVFLVIAYSLWRKVRAFLRQVTDETARRAPMRPAANLDPEEAQRVRQIQEEIRRKIAERRGGEQRAAGGQRPVVEAPPILRRATVPPLDPFGGPMRKIAAEVERRIQPNAPISPPDANRRDAAHLERQEQLAAQLRTLEEARAVTARRAAQTAASVKTHAESEAGMRAHSRGSLLGELRDPRSLRRAFVLREVLGVPVGLR